MSEVNSELAPIHQATIDQLLDGQSTWDKRLIHWGSYINPILIKETRQALKSSQFAITFVLLILLTGTWTFMAILSSMPTIYYASNGQTLLYGYITILIIPAFLVIPLSSFHSMASELDDGTFESISLSLLRPYRIVVGKLSVAIMQLGVYLSVIAPCIAMTYLLRGLTLYGILMAVILISVASIASSAIGIALATLSRTRGVQLLLNIVFLISQLILMFMAMAQLSVLSYSQAYGTTVEFSLNLIGFLWIGIPFTILMLTIACVRISDASMNKSTPVRWATLLFGLALATVGIFSDPYLTSFEIYPIASLGPLLALFWAFAGILMVGELGFVSVRTMREMPSNLMSRAFLSWFIPGPGTGYVFSVLTCAGCLISVWWCFHFASTPISFETSASLGFYLFVHWMYVACHVGIARILSLLLERGFGEWKMLSTLTMMIVFHVLACIFTTILSGLFLGSYQPFCILNPYWTIVLLSEELGSGNIAWRVPEVWIFLVPSTIVLFVINLALAARGIVIQRIETPKLVQQQRHPEKDLHRDVEEEIVDPLA